MKQGFSMGRREFVRLAQAGMAVLPLGAAPARGQELPAAAVAQEGARTYAKKIKLGLVGCGGRRQLLSSRRSGP